MARYTENELKALNDTIRNVVVSEDQSKAVAKHAASANKGLKVTSFGKGNHFIHGKHDEDGADGHINVRHDSGKYHVSHEGGGQVGSSGSKTFGDHKSAMDHAHKIAKSMS